MDPEKAYVTRFGRWVVRPVKATGFAAVALAVTSGAICAPRQVSMDLRANDHVLAVGDPLVTVILYTDFECSYCGRFAREAFPGIEQDYVDTGDVRWVFRHLPLSQIHAHARKAAEATECAGEQGLFWEYHDVLFNHQSQLTVAHLKSYAGDLGLDQAAFDACLDSGAQAARVQEDVDAAAADHISMTPSFAINGELYEGYGGVAYTRALLDDAIAQAGGG
jgi:protein-disulfide isomerase